MSADEAPASLTRRDFVKRAAIAGAVLVPAIGAAALVGLSRKAGRALAGGFVEDGAAAGHRLRDGGAWPTVRRTAHVPIVIVGGGMAGLSAAWWLVRRGMHDFVVLELQSEPGGNSRAGETEGMRHPWGAHYVPVPDARAEWVRLLFEEMGVFAGGAWRETDLCAAPKERAFVHGRWREGLVEALALGARDRVELRRFGERVAELRASGEFTIPMAMGARTHAVADSPLDRLTMDAWLAREGFGSAALRWLADYACRDDFGTAARDASAWAALHYFAARAGDDEGPLTWPDGNGRIVRHLVSRVGERVIPSAPVHRVERAGTRAGAPMRVLAGDRAWTCDAVVWAAPTFLASRVVEGAPRVAWDHAPWMVANLVLDRMPRESAADFPRAWDNVIADSRSLGYVVATHQALTTAPEERSVWTHYWALADEAPAAARQRLLAADWRSCAELVLADLERAHPDIRECVSRVDVRRYGHAMPRPVPGFLAAHAPWWRQEPDARVLWANSDVSGLSLFEEAQYRGIVAAEGAMELVQRSA